MMCSVQRYEKLGRISWISWIGTILLCSCGNASVDPLNSSTVAQSSTDHQPTLSSLPMASSTSEPTTDADVLAVETSGDSGSYLFSVTLQSPDTGCDQYANWWEVINEEGTLIHRRILLHSHVNEQPFSRSSGPVAIRDDQSVIVRAHMHPHGYGGQVLQGSVTQGFSVVEVADDFAVELAQQPPLPTGCSF